MISSLFLTMSNIVGRDNHNSEHALQASMPRHVWNSYGGPGTISSFPGLYCVDVFETSKEARKRK